MYFWIQKFSRGKIGATVVKSGPTSQLRQIQAGMLTNLADVVAESLRAAILSGQLKSGERILQDSVSADLGVSRQPVRDALHRLHAEGLVTELPNGRVIVREYSHDDICENYLLRRILESQAARIATVTMSDDEISELELVNQSLTRATADRNSNTILNMNDRFHHLIRTGARHRTLDSFISSLWAGYTIATPLSVPGRAERSITEHEAIVSALRARDPQAAADAMTDHIDAACRDFLRSSGQPPSPALAMVIDFGENQSGEAS
jgi:DNA-binding GntR family transcriptional regulator